MAPLGTKPGPYQSLPAGLADLTIAQIWTRIESWLAAKHPEFLPRLGPPVAESEIDELERAVGARLPADYRASLGIHAGSEVAWSQISSGAKISVPYADSAFHFLRLLPPKVVVARWSWFASYATFSPPDASDVVGAIQRAFYHPGWLPIAALDEDGALFDCLDTVPTVPSAQGQIVSVCTKDDDRNARWPSFRHYLAGELLLRLESGRVDEEETAYCGAIVMQDEDED